MMEIQFQFQFQISILTKPRETINEDEDWLEFIQNFIV